MATPLLPERSLDGIRVGISLSDSEDIGLMGLTELHFQLALGEIARSVLVAGGTLIFGGRLGMPSTDLLVGELQRYARLEPGCPDPLLFCLAWPEHRRQQLSKLELFRRALGLRSRVVCLDPTGIEVDPSSDRGEDPLAVAPDTVVRSLTSMRHYMARNQDGRVFIGGRRRMYEGMVAGLIEEAQIALSEDQPIYLAGGFGGATLDIARGLGIVDDSWLPRGRMEETDGLHLIEAMSRRPGWRGLNNGLTEDENRWLAITHRPSDIATLVSLGLGRIADQRSRSAGS